MSPLPAWLQTPPPTLGLSIDPVRVTAVLVEPAGTSPVIRAVGTSRVPEGALVPSLTAANVVERGGVVNAIQEAVDQVGGRHKRVALALPDTAGKVSLLPLETVPASARDLEQLIRLQLRKAIPFSVDEAQVTWATGPTRGTAATVVATAMRRTVVQEYEGLCASVGLQAGTVDLATFNVVNLALLGGGVAAPDDTLIVHATPTYASVAVVRDGELIFFRTRPTDPGEPVPDVVHQTRMFYEDRLAGEGFGRVLLVAGLDVDDRNGLAREIGARLNTAVTPLTLDGVAGFAERIATSESLVGQIAAPAGLVLREVGA